MKEPLQLREICDAEGRDESGERVGGIVFILSGKVTSWLERYGCTRSSEDCSAYSPQSGLCTAAPLWRKTSEQASDSDPKLIVREHHLGNVYCGQREDGLRHFEQLDVPVTRG